MICLKCEKEKFTEKSIRVEQVFKGETLSVLVPAMTCNSCGFHQFSDEQANQLRKETVDSYRKKRNLLTSTEILEYRNSLGMGQIAFADYLGVGSASVKRWETYFVQEKSQDDLIRIKCDTHLAEMNALEVAWAHDRPDEFNGQRVFNPEIFKNVLAKFVELAASPLFFFKIIFYVDFIHFKRFQKGITGIKYSCFEYGPIPEGYNHLLSYILDKKWFERVGKHDLKSNMAFDESQFSTDELSTINYVYSLVLEKGKRYLYEKSHKENAFSEGFFLETISYEKAKNLKLG